MEVIVFQKHLQCFSFNDWFMVIDSSMAWFTKDTTTLNPLWYLAIYALFRIWKGCSWCYSLIHLPKQHLQCYCIFYKKIFLGDTRWEVWHWLWSNQCTLVPRPCVDAQNPISQMLFLGDRSLKCSDPEISYMDRVLLFKRMAGVSYKIR